MEDQVKKCSSKKHIEEDAIVYCQECRLYLCKKCNYFHSELFQDHHQYDLNGKVKNIFTGLCQEINHTNELKYYCKNHNKLCCVYCIAKIKDKEIGQHKDCEILHIENIKEEKENNLKNNIKYLEDISKSVASLINELNLLFNKIKADKEMIIIDVQKTFTKIGNILNEREDELLLFINKHFENLYGDESILKKNKNLVNEIKKILEKSKLIKQSKNKLNKFIYDCINLEKSVNEIKTLNENFKKCKENYNMKNNFIIENIELNNFLQSITITKN